MVDSRATRNHITLKVVEQLGILYREKEKPYSLVTILGEPVLYRDNIINLHQEFFLWASCCVLL